MFLFCCNMSPETEVDGGVVMASFEFGHLERVDVLSPGIVENFQRRSVRLGYRELVSVHNICYGSRVLDNFLLL